VIGSRLRVAPGTAHRARSTPGPQPLVWPGRYRALVANAGSPMNHAAGESFTWTNTESIAGAPVEADVAGMQQVLDGSLVSGLNHLKNAAQAADPT
jgi:hypothetical protein